MSDTAPKPPERYLELTVREYEVAIRLAQGMTNREIAIDLGGVSVKTIDTHRGNVLRKLGCKGNVALCRLMIRDGLVQP